jgi:hypothetical protein
LGSDFFSFSPTEEGPSFFGTIYAPSSVRDFPASRPLASTKSNNAELLLESQKAKAIQQIANISKLLRDAIDAALPVALEQYLTIAVPGTTIDTRDIVDGGTSVYGTTKPTAFPPTQLMQEEAKLVDNMVPLSYVMVLQQILKLFFSYTRLGLTMVLPDWKYKKVCRAKLQPSS